MSKRKITRFEFTKLYSFIEAYLVSTNGFPDNVSEKEKNKLIIENMRKENLFMIKRSLDPNEGTIEIFNIIDLIN